MSPKLSSSSSLLVAVGMLLWLLLLLLLLLPPSLLPLLWLLTMDAAADVAGLLLNAAGVTVETGAASGPPPSVAVAE